ncbi:MAG: PQQ-binding-like beta-propeller repeat protein [Chloroflexota bacterium]
MKLFSKPRRRFMGAALLLILVLSACGSVAGESWANISTDGKYIYAAYQEKIFRINPVPEGGGQPTDRHIEWLVKSPNNTHMYAAPAISDDKVLYEGAYDKQVYAFPQNTSQVVPVAVGSQAGDRYAGGALVKGDIVYIGMGDKGVKAIDRKANKDLWNFTDTQYGVWATPIIVGNTLYFPSLDHNLYALNVADGKLQWKLDMGGAVAGTPLYDNGLLYVGTFSNKLLSVNLEQHKVVNSFTTRGWAWGTPVILKDGDSETLYFADLAGWVYALDPTTFDKKWEANDADHPGSIRGRLALAKVQSSKWIVISGSESKYLRAYDAKSGDMYWTSSITTDDKILSDLIVMGDEVIFTTLSTKQMVAAYNIETGQPSWRVNLDDELTRLQTATNLPIATAGPETVEPTQAAPTATQQK